MVSVSLHSNRTLTKVLSPVFLSIPEVAPPTISWILPHPSLIRKITPEACLQANMMEVFSQVRSLFPDKLSLYQDDKKCRAN